MNPYVAFGVYCEKQALIERDLYRWFLLGAGLLAKWRTEWQDRKDGLHQGR